MAIRPPPWPSSRRHRRDCREVGALVYVDATATIGGMEIAADVGARM
jgi:hypothetical protein